MIDVICPIYNIDLKQFKINLSSWFENIPIKTLHIGIGKENRDLEMVLSDYSNVRIYYQQNYNTLGFCLQELIKAVKTPYFIYFHSDVKINESWFNDMWYCRVKGIIESFKDNDVIQSKRFRSYSGAQLIYSECLKDLDWDDDYVYTSEDLLIQNHIIDKGYDYIKLPIYHTHFGSDNKRSRNREIILNWQYKALIKYGVYNDHMRLYISKTIRHLNKEFKYNLKLKKEIKKIKEGLK